MRVANWNPGAADEHIYRNSMKRLEKAAEEIATEAKRRVPVGQSRPPYKGGKAWTARQAGMLKQSIRVVKLRDPNARNVRVYAGHRQSDKLTAYYAQWVEYGTSKMVAKPFLRPAYNAVRGRIKTILGAR
jgi:HK97 gp10 family phage protein